MVRQRTGPDDARPTAAAALVPEQRSSDAPPVPARPRPTGTERTRLRTGLIAVAMLATDVVLCFASTRYVANHQQLPVFVAGSDTLRYTRMEWLLPAAWILVLGAAGGYRTARTLRLTRQFSALTRAGVMMLALVSAVSLITKLDFSRGFLGWSLIAFMVGAALVRGIAQTGLFLLHRQGRFTERVLLVGLPEDTSPIASHFERRRRSGYSVVGVVSPPTGWADRVEAADAGIDAVLSSVARTKATAVIIAGTQLFGAGGARHVAGRLTSLGIDVLIAPEIDEFGGPGVEPQPVADLLLLRARSTRLSTQQRLAKWLLDRVGGLFLIVVSLPVMLVIAVGIRIGSKGPVIFRQQRVGRDGRLFRIYKFRTMVADAEERLHRDGLYEEYVANGFKLPPDRDSRITGFGRFLRRSSLDELPQLFNVVAGSMSLVGPRPVLELELERYGEYRDAYLELRPGMTGYWQINGRSEIDFPERAELDAFYASNRSFKLDLLILSRTVTSVIRRDGAH